MNRGLNDWMQYELWLTQSSLNNWAQLKLQSWLSTESVSMELYCFLQKFSGFCWVSFGTQDFSKKKYFSWCQKREKKSVLDTPINRIFLFKQHSSIFYVFHLTLFRWGLPYRRTLCIFSPQLSPQYLVSLAKGLKINIYPIDDMYTSGDWSRWYYLSFITPYGLSLTLFLSTHFSDWFN